MNVEHDRLAPNRTEITSKVIEGEAIIINLRDGTYYSLDAVGSRIWARVLAESTLDEIVEAVCRHFGVDDDVARADAVRLLVELAEAKMLAPSQRGAPDADDDTPTARAGYAPPQLESFHDMAELLALDPPTPGVLDELMRGRIDDADD